ncbi:8-amino-7-oxononanoate synthase [Polaromonas naphthalenivorans]|uniref:8-amino-7-oxononanoate synthase n=1 Tax=Polaromonas naphthalenivorans (strain CJ2) TaxID=365044 RepID=BIOF_POLNA|nr:8-amino-7-oxononanoate synthase [Polaromonas naphthalenivorans]A1VUJ6.2 RecName: Full=8-amino-7-oxononanoate synthase; Short=AONS; AltName: Full=7-keto-8-amino-pelargonic acid synthase; Short=7-KAP synthase; Short=KAPA synthase; AltName: Full=8-amino-7-ketopelargonate synthase [Polaromonas naphthalenivorans CJ2]
MLIDYLNHQLREREAQGLTRQRRIAESPCAPRQRVSQRGQPARDLLAFCSNDYLGLANHPALVRALAEGAQLYGAGSGASHLISGHSEAHAALEADLAAWLAPCIPNAQALYFCTGYMANLALLTALGGANATIFADKLNHASLVDGALLAKATLQRYAHKSLAVLARQLAACDTPIKLIVTDAVFSMDGDVADLPELLALAERFDAWLVVDDAHGFGVLGEEGRGSLSHFGLCSERLICMGTLGKAAGVGGAFVAAHPSIIDWLVQTARPYIYTTAAPPAVAHALRESLRLIGGTEGDQRRKQLQQLISQLRSQLAELIAAQPALGWHLADSSTAIQPLIVGSNEAALALAAALDAQGLWVPAIRPPTVPAGTARLRITLSASHSADDVRQLVDALAQAGKDLAGAQP